MRTDWQSLDYYVTMIRGNRTAFLAGPFKTHTEALAAVPGARDLACEVDPRAWWDAFGTSSLPRAPGNPVGKLNSRLGANNC